MEGRDGVEAIQTAALLAYFATLCLLLRRLRVRNGNQKAVDAGGGIAAEEEHASGAITNGNVQDVEYSSTPAAARPMYFTWMLGR